MSTVSDQDLYRMRIKTCVMERLYERQLEFWNRKLKELSRENADSYGRDPSEEYAIFFRNRRWVPENLDWTDNEPPAYCLPLNPKIPDFEKRMAEIADEFEELCNEKYEAERFLSNIVLFAAPPKRYREILGETIYSFVRDELEAYCPGIEDRDWEVNNEYSMKEYVEANQRIIKSMNERVLLNLVTL